MGKGSTQILIQKILESLAAAPKSSSEIAEETGLDRTSISRYLELLKESGFVTEQKEGTSRKFILSSTYRLDTYFGLPLNPEEDKLVDSLYCLIQKKWKELNERELLKTTAQKIIYQIMEDCNLKIPRGWYIYGGISVKPYDSSYSYGFTGVSDDVIPCVDRAVGEYSKNKFEYESRRLQYEKAGKELYDVKEETLRLLYSKNFSKKSVYVFQKLFSKFWRLAPKGDEAYAGLLNNYDTLLIDVTKEWDAFVDENNEMHFAEFKQKLIASFEAVWKMVATINFKQDLKEFYLEKELDEHFKLGINKAKEDVLETGSELYDMMPFQEPDDPLYGKIKKALRELNEPSDPEKLRKQNEELDKIREEMGEEAFQDELLRRFGIK